MVIIFKYLHSRSYECLDSPDILVVVMLVSSRFIIIMELIILVMGKIIINLIIFINVLVLNFLVFWSISFFLYHQYKKMVSYSLPILLFILEPLTFYFMVFNFIKPFNFLLNLFKNKQNFIFKLFKKLILSNQLEFFFKVKDLNNFYY